jgi:hypothetical protein
MALARVGSGRVRGSRNYRKFVRFAAVLALGVMFRVSYAGTGADRKISPGIPDAVTCGSGNQFTFTNSNSYPVWLGEAYQGVGSLSSNIITPPGGDWKISAASSVNLCMPSGWSGNFWARTGCDFDGLFSNEADFKTCATSTDCGMTNGVQDICYGGKCLIDCSSGGVSLCQGATGLNDSNAVCLSGAGGTKVCSFTQVCQTGDCGGLFQCYGTWESNDVKQGGAPPVSLFEPTSNSATDVNYDVSLVSGYNTAISVSPSAKTCYAPGCVTDLNQVCPSNLLVTASPVASPGPTPIPCGNGFCQTGFCQNAACVIGCNQPGIQCSTASPPAGLQCNTVVPSPAASPFWTPDGASYADMYSAKNSSGNVTPDGLGISMASGNQGTATCWADTDCAPGKTCDMGLVSAFPSGVGLCSPVGPPINCAVQADVGNSCGGY